MNLIRSVPESIDYAATLASKTVNTIVTTPSALKKALQVGTKVLALIEAYQPVSAIQERKVYDAMDGSIKLLEFVGLINHALFWINPFSKETIDKSEFEKSFIRVMCDPIIDDAQRNTQRDLAVQIVNDVMAKQTFSSPTEVRKNLSERLVVHYKPEAAANIANRVTIQQNARPITKLFSAACFTTVDLVGSIQILNKWGLINVAKIAAQVGGQSRVFAFVMDLSVGTVLGTIASAGLIVVFSEAAYRAVSVQMSKSKMAPLDMEGRNKANAEIREAILTMISSGADLVNTATPLLVSLSPPVVISLAIFAKGTGLICILVRIAIKEREATAAAAAKEAIAAVGAKAKDHAIASGVA